MKLLIDMQGAQAEYRHRGIERYVMALVRHLLKHSKEHEIHLLINGNLSESAGSLQKQFAVLMNPSNIHSWFSPLPIHANDRTNQRRRQMAQEIYLAKIETIAPDVFFIPSLFEGKTRSAMVTVPDKTSPFATVVTSHDLIPMLYTQEYFHEDESGQEFYFQQLEQLKRADRWIAISNSSKQELVEHLDLPETKIHTTYLGVEPQFKPSEETESLNRLPESFKIDRPYFLYTGGGDPRKNLGTLVNAFAALDCKVRDGYQLVLAGELNDSVRHQLQEQIQATGLDEQQVRLLGYISEKNLIRLYQQAFCLVFPSRHEGFGLPAVEAMACGIPVIVSNQTSLPEIVDHSEALFDPSDSSSLTQKLLQMIQDETLRRNLADYSLQRSRDFCWERCAEETMQILELAYQECTRSLKASKKSSNSKHEMASLAMVSPMPPEQTGIADYFYELLPALDKLFKVELVVNQAETHLPDGVVNTTVRDLKWFEENADRMGHIVYQMGNSPFHTHMLELMQRFPGALVLHDFFLSALYAHLEATHFQPYFWTRELFHSHGYPPLLEKLAIEPASDKKMLGYKEKEALRKARQEISKVYPVNLSVLQAATKVFVHSQYSKDLASEWYGDAAGKDWQQLPLVRDTRRRYDRNEARAQLSMDEQTVMICSFGILSPSKFNHRLLESYSRISRTQPVKLVFVGKCSDPNYQKQLEHLMAFCPDVEITGWASAEQYHQYLAASDIAVQLRTNSRGETSAAVLDAMNYGLPTIVNANGSMAELPQNGVWLLEDEFHNSDLVFALQTLIDQPEKRQSLGQAAREHIMQYHTPEHYAKELAEALTSEAVGHQAATFKVIQSLSQNVLSSLGESESAALAEALDITFVKAPKVRKIYLDMSATLKHDLKTGIERYAKAVALELIAMQKKGFQVEVVSLEPKEKGWGYRTARNAILEKLGFETGMLRDQWVEPSQGDMVVTLDLASDALCRAAESNLFEQLTARGVKLYATVFDLLPVEMPQHFPPGADQGFSEWLNVINGFHGALCISQSTANALRKWRDSNSCQDEKVPYRIGVIPMGADFTKSDRVDDSENAQPSEAMQEFLAKVDGHKMALIVGTLEPRKGHLQLIGAFEKLWKQGSSDHLVIVGREGWQGLPDSQRRTIPELVQCIQNHPENGKKLHWLQGIDDIDLQAVYRRADGLVIASEGEGFGLPLIEAAHHQKPVLARDIEVFREIAVEGTQFFPDQLEAEPLADAIKTWLGSMDNKGNLEAKGIQPSSWSDCADRIWAWIQEEQVF